MTRERVHQLLEPHYPILGQAFFEGYRTYLGRYPHRPIHRRTTAANVTSDEIWAALIRAFDEVPGVRVIEQPRGLRFLGIANARGETDLLLWPKKVDRHRNPRNYPTSRARHLLSGGNLEMFKKATVLVVGYLLSPDQKRISRVSISRPSIGRPEWYIDLHLPGDDATISMTPTEAPPSASGARVVAIRVTEQTRLAE